MNRLAHILLAVWIAIAVMLLATAATAAESAKPTRIIYSISKPDHPMLVRVYKDWDQYGRDVADPNANDFEMSMHAGLLITRWNWPAIHVAGAEDEADLNGDGFVSEREYLAYDPISRAAMQTLLAAWHIEDPEALLGEPRI